MPSERGIAMLKKVGLLFLIGSLFAVSLPQAAFAQDGYRWPRDYYYQRDRDWNRYEARKWREHEWRKRRAEEWSERKWRERQWRENRWWERGWDRPYYPDTYLYFGFGR
jgi:hypothetical protein